MKLKVSQNKRYFELDGKPFCWLGDTAWLLFSRLTLEEGKAYLKNRALQGFTVIQATLVHSKDYHDLDGNRALNDDDFANPVPLAEGGFWDKALKLVRYAKELGLFMGLLPAWGSFVLNGNLNKDNCESYADFLSEVFGKEENVIWIVGGDVMGNKAPDVFRMIGRRLKADCPENLVGYHPYGRCDSSFWFHTPEDTWLDFDMFQSGHRDYNQREPWDGNPVFYGEDNYRYVQEDRKLDDPKPTIDGEPSYELIPHGLHDGNQPYWQAADVRRYAYWSVFSGAAGHTYGNNAIMQFLKPGYKPAYAALETWDVALHDVGSGQMRQLKKLFMGFHFEEGEPRQDLIAGENGEKYLYKAAFLTKNALLVYSYNGDQIKLNTDLLPFEKITYAWFDTVSGAVSFAGAIEKSSETVFTVPDRRSEVSDRVLIVLNANKDYDLLKTVM